ncbi:polysaccharide export protein [Flavobacterium sp. NST-5]|uniref:Polysaccharide export protein n=1 Tax=Flavobacterium ichthyis TaxID=2698827 RepID=A0ABW9Z9I6_9FLAO|nr:polysaccharide biosynthesis/export family protein [Flavobacterium ichthyis]NBL64826.1 polysaccharide export protein [Flavobacterium ichthyis]
MKKNKILLFIGIALLLISTSCASKKGYNYYQNIEEVVNAVNEQKYQTAIHPDDLLMITVMGIDPEVTAPFNQSTNGNISSMRLGNESVPMNSYLVDAAGEISFPMVGKMKLAGLSREQAVTTIKEALKKYIKDPEINLRILNYKITVQGEVNRPGVFPINSERITLPEALSMAGDLTGYGKRNNILVIRDNGGKKEMARVDITQADFLNSPYYYLAQNDVIYVEPNKTRINASAVGPNTSIIISSLSLLLTVIALIIR